MDNSNQTFKISKDQIRDVYSTLKNLSDSYKERMPGQSDSEWLANQYRTAFPNLSGKEAAQLGEATVNGVQRFNNILKDAMASASTGQTKEQWFSEKMSQEIKGMDINEAGAYIHSIDSALLSGNQHLIEKEPIQIQKDSLIIDMPSAPDTTDSSDAAPQWNPFTVKEVLSHLGQSAALTGLQTMNHSEGFHFAADAIENMSDSAYNLKSMIENGDSEQLKALLTAAIKIGADNHKLPFLSSAASVDTIAGIASNGVEYLSTLSKFSSGEITMMQAMDHVGLSGVSLLYDMCSSDGIRNISVALLSGIPIIGPILGNVVGGILSVTLGQKVHEKVQRAIQKVETKVRSAVNTAWNAIKSVGQKIKSKVKSFCNWLFA